MNKLVRAHLALLSAMIIYAASFTIAKLVTPEFIKPFGLVVLRAIGAVLLFWLSSLFIKEKTDKKDIPRFALLAIFGVAINQLMFLKGLSLTSSINAAIIMITSPIIVLVIAAIVIKEKVTILKFTGIILGFTGAASLMLFSQSSNGKSANLLGDLFIFINATSWSFYLVMVKPIMKKYHTITILKWVFLFGLILVTPFGWSELGEVQWQSLSSLTITYTVFIVVFTTFVAYLLNTYALNLLSPSVVSAYIYLQPFLAAVIALGMGKDTLDINKIIAAIMIFAGVYLAGRPMKK